MTPVGQGWAQLEQALPDWCQCVRCSKTASPAMVLVLCVAARADVIWMSVPLEGSFTSETVDLQEGSPDLG